MSYVRVWFICILPLALLFSSPAFAGVEGSPHDVIAQGYDVVKDSVLQERCSRCHIPSASGQKAIVPDVPQVLESIYAAASLVCFSCHDGTTIVSPAVDASRSAFHAMSHGTGATTDLGSEEPGAINRAGRMECLTCHDPHDNSHRPFLRLEMQELCLSCHSKYAEFGIGKENRSGNHILAPEPLVVARPEVPLTVSPDFRVPFPAGYPLGGGKDASGVRWTLGGHLAAGGEGAITCCTCHAVHGDGDSPPRRGLLTVEQENDVANRLCEGCHAGERGDGIRSTTLPNPGGTTVGRTYHPVDDDVANGEGRSVEVVIPEGWPVGRGNPPRLICTSCHAAHGARPETPLLRTPEVVLTFCESCHSTPLPLHHHPVSSDGKCDQNLPPPPEGEPPGMSCSLCHRAHNAGFGAPDEKRYVPLLRQQNDAAACAVCHPENNPTCGTRPEYQASHYLGDPLEDYGDTEPPLRREPWPESGLRSSYGEPDNRSVTCLSCHTFQKGSIASGDDGKGGYLLARSGNKIEWAEGGESTYLCAGCHSADPKTGEIKGHSHPMMNADATKLGRPATPPVTISPDGKVNCDSCHRPHEAVTRGGVYILEEVGGENTDPLMINPTIDFTPICHLCHDPGKY